MAHCAHEPCGRWQPDLLARRGRTGLSFEGQWYCSRACVESSARRLLREVGRQVPAPTAPRVPPIKLGALLLHQRALSADTLDAALDAQRKSRRRLGHQLLASGVLSQNDLLRALAAQSSSPYLVFADPASPLPAVCGLSRDAVSALGLVPFAADPDEQRVKVACMAPLPRMAIRALRELTGWAVEPYLVWDAQWPALLAAYRAAGDGTGGDATVATLDKAAARIARAARRDGDVRLVHAHCAPFVWVRVEGERSAEDLLVPVADAMSEETSCRAALTLH